MIWIVLIGASVLLAWSNGANDNFKGVATLYGSGAMGYRAALRWASVTTLAGGLTSVLLADQLVKTFSGAHLMEGGLLDPTALVCMVAAAGLTVLIASAIGMPTSTTHALMGGLLGVALALDPARIRWDRFAALFLVPMLVSPCVALAATTIIVRLQGAWQRGRQAREPACLCAVREQPAAMAVAGGALAWDGSAAASTIRVWGGRGSACSVHPARTLHPDRTILRVDTAGLARGAHILSGGAVCFARALNDTPKIAAVLLTIAAIEGGARTGTLAVVAICVVLGGILQGRRVAQTMGHKITELTPASGLTANVVTASLVLCASRLGLPVSTTHVSCSSILGAGLATRRARLSTMARILTTWLTTLPFAAALAAGAYALLRWSL